MVPPITTQHGRDARVVDLARGDPGPELLPAALVRAAADRATAGLDPNLLQYGHEQGDAGFRAALATWLEAEGAGEVAPERLFVTAGASLALHLVCALFTRPGERVLVADPTYHLALAQFADHDLHVEGVASDAEGIVPEALAAALAAAPAALLYLVPAYANPSGATMSPVRQQAVVRLAERHGVRVVADEVYRLTGFAEADRPRSLAASQADHVLSLNSVSKVLSPGLRLGWIEGPPADLERLARSGVLRSGGGLNPFVAAVVREAIVSGALHAHLQRVRAVLAERHEVLVDALRRDLPQARFTPVAGGYFLWLRLPGLDVRAPEVREGWRRYGVRVAPGTLFTPAADDGTAAAAAREHLRVCFAHATPAVLREGVRRLAAALEAHER